MMTKQAGVIDIIVLRSKEKRKNLLFSQRSFYMDSVFLDYNFIPYTCSTYQCEKTYLKVLEGSKPSYFISQCCFHKEPQK
jgi:hypothetical protein